MYPALASCQYPGAHHPRQARPAAMRMPAPQRRGVTRHLQDDFALPFVKEAMMVTSVRHLQDEDQQQHDDFALSFLQQAVKRTCVEHDSSWRLEEHAEKQRSSLCAPSMPAPPCVRR